MNLIRNSPHRAVCLRNDGFQDVTDIINWSEVYTRLLGENRIWDFRDLFVTMISVYGWERTTSLMFGPKHIFDILERINQDWRQHKADESMVLGLLDLFTSLILQNRTTEKRQITELLCIYSRKLAGTIQSISLQHMKTRPFIQWIIAKFLTEVGAVPPCSDDITPEEFPGLSINHGGNGIHLPIFVPVKHTNKPEWSTFYAPANPAQIRSIEVAIQAAGQIGDYSLQSLGLKILALRSKDPGGVLDTLATVQLRELGDREGFLHTCLSRYLTLRSQDEKESLLKNFKEVDTSLKGSKNKLFISATFLWARDVIRGHLEAHSSDEIEKSAVWWLDLDGYGSELPQYVVDFVNQNRGSSLSSSKQSTTTIDIGSTVAQPEPALKNSRVSDQWNCHQQKPTNVERSLPPLGNPSPSRPNPFDFLVSDSASHVTKTPSHNLKPPMDSHGFVEGRVKKELHPSDERKPLSGTVESGYVDDPRAQRLKRRYAESNVAIGHISDLLANDPDSSRSEIGSALSTEESLLEIPFAVLESHTMTVTITSNTDPSDSKTYVVDKNGATKCATNNGTDRYTQAQDIHTEFQEAEPEELKRTTQGQGKPAPDDSVNARKPSNSVGAKERRRVSEKLPNRESHKDFGPVRYNREIGSDASYFARAQASMQPWKQHQIDEDEDLAHKMKSKEREAETAQRRNNQATFSQSGRTGRMPGSPLPLRPVTRTLSDRRLHGIEGIQGIGRTSSWPMSMPPTTEYDSQWHNERMYRDSSKIRAARRTQISKEALDQLNERSASKSARKNRISGSVKAHGSSSEGQSVVDSHDLELERLSDEEDLEADPVLPEEISDRMKGVPEPPSRRKVQIKEAKHGRSSVAATTEVDSKERKSRKESKTRTSTKDKGKEKMASQVRGSSEPGASRRPMTVQIQDEDEEENRKHEEVEQAEAKSESAKQEGHKNISGDQHARWGLGITQEP